MVVVPRPVVVDVGEATQQVPILVADGADAERGCRVARARDLDDFLRIGVAMLGGLAIVISAVGILRHEKRRPAIAGMVVGTGAILFQFFAFAFFALLGVLVIMALLNSFSDVFSGLFGG